MENKSHLLNRLFVGVLAAACVAVSVTGCGDNAAKGDNAAQNAVEAVETVEGGNDTTPTEETAQSGSEGETADNAETALPFEVTFSDSVPNDKTGRWRLATTTESVEIQNYAADYYKTYFAADNEIHAFVNFADKTTSCISLVAGKIDVTVHQYVDKEETDAAELFGGDVFAEYWVDMDTGDVEQIR